MSFTIHTSESAPEASRPILAQVKKAYGLIPNVLAELAEAPVALEGYATLSGILGKGRLTPTEQQVVAIAASAANRCSYCVAAHSTVGKRAVPADVLVALRDGRPLPDAKLEALRAVVESLIEKRGWLADDDLTPFFAAGYEKAHLLEVIAWIGFKTISNFVNHIAETPLDAAFEAQRWEAPAGIR